MNRIALSAICLLAAALASLAQDRPRIDLDPSHYSAGKMSAAKIDRWFSDNIKPEQFDLWFGKRERLYLNGAWKFVRFAEIPVKTEGQGAHIDFTAPDCELGESAGFFKPGFDDSTWFAQPVPYLWLYRFEPNAKTMAQVAGGPPIVGWYRKRFVAPAQWKGDRILLHFRGASWKSSVYLNGELLGVHEDSRKTPNLWLPGYRSEESFTFDVTDALVFGGDNLLAVKVYSPAANGGIWQEVYLEPRPNVYVERALVTPLPDKSAVKVKAFLVNATGQDAKLSLTAEFAPWRSSRYHLAAGEAQTVSGPKLALKPGSSVAEFELPLKNPQYWSPERPYLYWLKLCGQEGRTVGQARFGYRAFTVGESRFLLNGKPVFLRSEDIFPCSWCVPGVNVLIVQFGLLNRGDVMERTLRSYMEHGYNYYRCQSTYPTHIYFDLADELGLIASVEETSLEVNRGVERLENGEAVLSQAFKDSIRARCLSMYNHPSICMFSCGNEVYDSYALTAPQWRETGFGPYLRAVHDEFKKHDLTRPATASSGRGPTADNNFSPITLQKNKGDFDDCHLYMSNRCFMSVEDDANPRSYKNSKAAYVKDNGGRERAMLDGESFWFFSDSSGLGGKQFSDRRALLPPHLSQNGELDRQWLAQTQKGAKSQESLGGLFEWSMIPFRVSADELACLRVQGKILQKVMELERRKRADLAGYVLHQPAVFRNFSPAEPLPLTGVAAKQAQQPVLACLDGLFNRNMIAGKTTKAKLYLLNDSESELSGASVALTLRDARLASGGTPFLEVPFAPVAVGGMAVKEVELTPPPSLASGHFQLLVDVRRGSIDISNNAYALYLFSPADMKVDAKLSAALYAPGGAVPPLATTLQRLKIPFKAVKSFSELDSGMKVLLLPPGSVQNGVDSKALLGWVAKGGKVLAFAQKSFLKGFLPGRLGPVGVGSCGADTLGWWTELVLPSHPVFKGLDQDDFYFWAGDGVHPASMKLAENAFLPLNAGALSMLQTTNCRTGASICEARHGEGRFLFSQLEALKRFEVDSVATRYVLNLLDYALGSFDDPRAPLIELGAEKPETYAIDQAKAFFVDLRPAATMGFADEVAGDGKGGWSDQGPENDARSLTPGKQTFAGVPFEIADPAANGGKACVVLRGGRDTKTAFLPEASGRIAVNRKAKKLFFLVAGTWIPPYYMLKPDEAMATLTVNMNINAKTGGTFGKAPVRLVPGKNYSDWWQPKDVPEALIGWRGTSGKKGLENEVGAYVVEWINPEPEVEVGWIDFKSAGRAVPILLGVTGEEER